jgi:hypothetical protein
MSLRKSILIVFIWFVVHLAFGQGCSDAGFCTLGAMRPNQSFANKKNVKLRSLELTHYIGYTKFKDIISTTLLDVNTSIGTRSNLQFKLPYTYCTGPLGSSMSFGDISYSFTYVLKTNDQFQLLTTVGGKIPTNNSNQLSDDGRPLPMYNQTSLGTYDFIAGASFLARNWLFATGIQMAFNQNGSQFKWGDWKSSPLTLTANEYPPSWNLKRGTDVMLRIERNFRSTKWNAYIGLLTIYRITKDEISKGIESNRIKVDKTTGAAITALTGVGYKFSTRVALKGLFGMKIINRETNPDGLSREWVTSLSVEFKL